MAERFTFTVTDLARFLGKSPVTLRGWERKGLLSIPRDNGGDRKLNTDEVGVIAIRAHELGRISDERLEMVEGTLYMIQDIERENEKQNANRHRRRSRVR